MAPNRHGRHAAGSRGGTSAARRLGTPLLAFLAVVVLAGGGWALLGRDTGAEARRETVALTGDTRAPAPAADRASREQADRAAAPAAPKLGGLAPAPAPATTSARPGTPAPAPGSPRGSARPPADPPADPPAGPPAPPAPTGAPAPAPAPPASPSVQAEVVRLTDVERAKAGCAPLRTDARLTAAAQAHSVDMVDRDYFSHTSPDGKGPGDRAAAAGYSSWSGENIAAGYPTPAAVVQGWMDSEGHRANILNCGSKAVGIGFDARKNMWTQLFGRE